MIQNITADLLFIYELQIVLLQRSHVRVYITSGASDWSVKWTKRVPKGTSVINKDKRVK